MKESASEQEGRAGYTAVYTACNCMHIIPTYLLFWLAQNYFHNLVANAVQITVEQIGYLSGKRKIFHIHINILNKPSIICDIHALS